MDEARRKQLEILRRMGPAGRLKTTVGMIAFALACRRRRQPVAPG